MRRYSSDARARPSSRALAGGSPSTPSSSAPPSSADRLSKVSAASSSPPPSPTPAPSAAEPSPAARRPTPSAGASSVVPRRSTPAPNREAPVLPPATTLGTPVGTPVGTRRTLPRDVSLTAALETGEAARGASACAWRRRASSALRALRVDVTAAAASATAASVRLGRRHRRRRLVLRGAAEVSHAAADVAVDAVEVGLAELVAAHGEGVAGCAASEATLRLRLATRAARFGAVAGLVAGSEAVEAQAVRAVARGVVEEAAQVAGFHLGGSRALRLAVPAAAASETTQGGELEVVVEVARHAKQATHLVVLALVLAGALGGGLAIGPGRGLGARRVGDGRLRVRRPVPRDRRNRTARGGPCAPRRLVEDERLVRVVRPGGVAIVRLRRRRRRRLRRGRPRPRAFPRHGARRCARHGGAERSEQRA